MNMSVVEELIKKVPKVKVEILGVEGKRVVAKIGRQRKPRRLIAFRSDKGTLVVQGDNTIIQFIDEERGLAIYNTNGEYFFHLRPEMGARLGIFPKEFVDALRSVVFRECDIIGYIEGAPVYFGGCVEI